MSARNSVARAFSRNLLRGLIFGVIGLTFGGTMFAFADFQRGVYESDATCTAGLDHVSHHGGACRTASMYVTNWYYSSGRNAQQHLVLRTATGSQVDIEVARNPQSNLWHYLLYPGGRSATVQYFYNDIVRIETRYGLEVTTAEPNERVSRWALGAIVSGIIGVGSALLSLRYGLALKRSPVT